MKYIIASVEGVRHDLAPKYQGQYGKVYHYGAFELIIYTCGDYLNNEYEKAYGEISDYCTKVNDELKGNRYYNGWMFAEMLTPNERHEYNDIHCKLFHAWFVDKMLTADEIIVTKTNVNGRDLDDRLNVYDNPEQIMKLARAVSSEMLRSIHVPGDYIHNSYMSSSTNIFLPYQPIFEFGYNLPYNIQIVDKSYSSAFKVEEVRELVTSEI